MTRGEAATSRVCLLVAALLALGADRPASIDCSARFPIGQYGFLQTEPAFKSGRLTVKDFVPLYLAKRPMRVEPPRDCRRVYPFDTFRLLDAQDPDALVAGCSGDFDGDHHLDFALLMKRVSDGAVRPVAFVARGAAFESFILDSIVDKEFEEEPGYWPGPTCEPRPATGLLKSEFAEGSVPVVGDLFSVGWYTYFWNADLKRPDHITTVD